MKKNFLRELTLFLLLILYCGIPSYSQSYYGLCGTPPSDTSSGSGGTSQNLNRPPSNTSCGMGSEIFNDFFRHKGNFIPEGAVNARTVLKKIKIRFIVADPGTSDKRNFKPEDISIIQGIASGLNAMLSDVQAPTKPQTNICGTCHIPNTRFQVELVGISFINTTPWEKWNEPTDNDGLILGAEGADSVLNISLGYYPNSHPTSDYAGIAYGSNPGSFYRFFDNPKLQYICMVNMYQAHLDGQLWGATRTLLHEVYHHFGLFHFYDDARCNQSNIDYLADVFNVGPLAVCGQTHPVVNTSTETLVDPDYICAAPTHPQYGNYTCDNNVMALRGYTYTTPMQMGIMHREAFMSSISRYTYPVNTDPSVKEWIVYHSQTWDFAIRMFQNIVVKSGTTLTITCEVQMPAGSRILVEKGAKLIVDGGRITSYHARTRWNGIEVVGNVNQPSNAAYQGTLILQNGAIIENANNGVLNFDTHDNVNGGGIIQASNSYFYNCARGVGLNNYPNYTYGNNCSFDKVQFLRDDASAVRYAGHYWDAQFSSWNVKGGVKIYNCIFKNDLTQDDYNQDARQEAIFASVSAINIVNNTITGFKKGVYGTNYKTLANRNLFIHGNNFNYNTQSIVVGSDAFSNIRSNFIRDMYPYTVSLGPNLMQLVSASGIYLNRTNGTYVGCHNNVDGTQSSPSFIANAGLVANHTNAGGATVLDNYFENITRGTQTQLNNPHLNITCNSYYNNRVALLVNSGSPSGYILKDQGTGCGTNQVRAGNKFISNTRDINNYLLTNWSYYAFTGITNTEEYPFSRTSNFGFTECNSTSSNVDVNSQCNKDIMCWVTPPGKLRDHILDFRALKAAGLRYEVDAQLLLHTIVAMYNEADDQAGLISFLEDEGDNEARKLLIPLYIENGEYTKATTALSSLTISSAEKTAYEDFYGILADMQQTSRQPNMLTTAEQLRLQELAASELEVSGNASALLETGKYLVWEHPVEDEVDTTSIITFKMPATIATAVATKLMDAAPNPAQQRTLITTFVTDADARSKPILVVTNMAGKELFRSKLQAGTMHTEVNTSNMQPGLYFYSILLNGKVYEAKKLSIVK